MTENPQERPADREKITRIAAEAWRELGFWYECRGTEKLWEFRADRQGLQAFAGVLQRYVATAKAGEPLPHLHLGPFSNLRIIRADHPTISWRGIAGRPEDFEGLIGELNRLADAHPGPHILASAFAQDDGFIAVVVVEPDGFDPASADTTFNPRG